MACGSPSGIRRSTDCGRPLWRSHLWRRRVADVVLLRVLAARTGSPVKIQSVVSVGELAIVADRRVGATRYDPGIPSGVEQPRFRLRDSFGGCRRAVARDADPGDAS